MSKNANGIKSRSKTDEAPKETLEECLRKIESGERYVAFLHDVKKSSQEVIIWEYELMRQLPPRFRRAYTIHDVIDVLYSVDPKTERYKWKKGKIPEPSREMEERVAYLKTNMGQFYGPEAYFTSLIILKNEYGYPVP